MKPRIRAAIGALLIAAIALVIVLASSGESHNAPQKKTVVRTLSGHTCAPEHYFMQCALTPPPRNLSRQAAIASGVDFAWSCPILAGKQFGASYFSPDHSKNWTLACVRAYHAHGQATVGVYESSANRATQGFNAGFTDAFNARNQARAVGEPDNRPIDYATDCDCSVASIFYYYVGADAGTASILHISHAAAVQLVGIYGGYHQVMGMFNAHVVGHTNWATYAWSGGLFPPASVAPLEQFLNDNTVDYDRAIAADYGQWPYTPPVVRVHCFGPHAQLADAHCKIVRPEVSRRTHEITRIRQVSYFHFHCWQRRPNGKVVSGVNGHRNFCLRLGRIERGDRAYIKANLY